MLQAICSNCVKDKHLTTYVNEHAKRGVCKYCHRKTDVCNLAPFFDFIEDSIRTRFDNPENGLGWIDGEWVPANGLIYDSYDLLRDYLELGDEAFIKELEQELGHYQWCRREFYDLSTSDELKFTWSSFKHQVQYRSRYLFCLEKMGCDDHIRFPEPNAILEQLGHLINDLHLVTNLNSGMTLYRARWSDIEKKFCDAESLGPPIPREAKKANRMSPAGIPMFYGADSIATCRAEVEGSGGITSVAQWRLLQDVPILDLTQKFTFDFRNGKYCYDDFPSIFDEGRRDSAEGYNFMLHFAADVSRALNSDPVEQIDYVPTQIVAEYLRRVYKPQSGGSLMGVRFYSAKDGGKNVTLFMDHTNCRPMENAKAGSQYLELVQPSITHIAVNTDVLARLTAP